MFYYGWKMLHEITVAFWIRVLRNSYTTKKLRMEYGESYEDTEK